MREVEAFTVSWAGDPVGHLLGFGGNPRLVDLGDGSVVAMTRCRLDDARHDRFFLEALFAAWLRSTLDTPYQASTFDLDDIVTAPREIAICTRAMSGGGVAVYTALGLDFWEDADELRAEVSSRFGVQYTDDVGDVHVAEALADTIGAVPGTAMVPWLIGRIENLASSYRVRPGESHEQWQGRLQAAARSSCARDYPWD